MQFRSGGFGGIPPVIKNLLIINALFFLATFALGKSMGIDLIDRLGLHMPLSEKFAFWQPLTHMFMHSNTSMLHIVFNMFALWMFGTPIEQAWGGKRFLYFYLFTGLGAAFTHELVVYLEMRPLLSVLDAFLANPSFDTLAPVYEAFKADPGLGSMTDIYSFPDIREPAVISQYANELYDFRQLYLNRPVAIGASGAVYGVLLAFGMMYPNARIMLIIPPIPIRAKYMVIILGVIALLGTRIPGQSNIAHAAHLGGMIFGYLMILYWNRKHNRPKSYF